MRRPGALLVLILLTACGGVDGSSGDSLPEPVASLDGDWVATEIVVDGTAVALDPAAPVTMSIDGDQATGVAACNSYGGTLRLGDDGSFALEGLAVTEMACEPATVMEIERAVIAAFGTLDRYALTDELVLTADDGTTSMTLVRATGGALDGTWEAVTATVDGAPVTGLDTVVVTMEVGGGRISGGSGCNQYEIDVDVGVDTITFGPRTATEAFCSGPPGEIEGLFGAVTSGTATWLIEADTLTLTNGAAVWVFERAGGAIETPATTPPDVFGGLDGPVMFAGPDAAVVADDTAVGTLFLGDNCLVLMRDDQTTMVLVIWPYGTTWQPDGSGVVLPPGDVLGFGPVVQVDGTVIDEDELPSYADNPAVRDEITRCTRTEQTLLFVAAP